MKTSEPKLTKILKENEDCDAEYYLCSWLDMNSLPKHRMVIAAKDICELMESYHKEKLRGELIKFAEWYDGNIIPKEPIIDKYLNPN